MILTKCIRQTYKILQSWNELNCAGSWKLNRYLRNSSAHFSDKSSDDEIFNKYKVSEDKEVPSILSGKYEIFKEENAPIIFDIEEERRKTTIMTANTTNTNIQESEEEFEHLDLQRGVRGVFDVEQLTDLLQADGAIDLCVIKLPIELKYTEHIVIVTGRSARHRKALAETVRKIFKKKMLPFELIPRIEGVHEDGTSLDWLAMDLGNIALHIFARNTRVKYDLESLWTLGCEHDAQCAKPDDPLVALLTSHSVYLGDLEPAEPSLSTKQTDTEQQ